MYIGAKQQMLLISFHLCGHSDDTSSCYDYLQSHSVNVQSVLIFWIWTHRGTMTGGELKRISQHIKPSCWKHLHSYNDLKCFSNFLDVANF